MSGTRKTRISEDLLDDSEAALRLVDSLLDDLRDGDEIEAAEGVEPGTVRAAEMGTGSTSVGAAAGTAAAGVAATGVADDDGSSALAQLPEVLLRAQAEIKVALESLRHSRGFLERTTLERVQRTQQHLQEVSSTTEQAATDMLDGLDRALFLIDRLDSCADPALADGSDAAAAEVEDAAAIRTELRDELFHLISNLQFQDITSQQLRYASGVLEEIETRLLEIAELFNVGLAELGTGAASAPTTAQTETYDPSATMLGAKERQAVADEIFGGS